MSPCKHFLIGQITNTDSACPYCMLEKANAQTEEFERKWYLTCDVVDELKGKQSVLIDLLRECLLVLNTIDGDDSEEIECLADLELKCEKAIEGALQ